MEITKELDLIYNESVSVHDVLENIHQEEENIKKKKYIFNVLNFARHVS